MAPQNIQQNRLYDNASRMRRATDEQRMNVYRRHSVCQHPIQQQQATQEDDWGFLLGYAIAAFICVLAVLLFGTEIGEFFRGLF